MCRTCHRMGRPPISTRGLGIARVCSWRRVPRPPQRMATGGRVLGRVTGGVSPGEEANCGPGLGTAADYCGPRPRGSMPKPMTPNPEIFKAYDIRGVYGEDIDAEIAYDIGRAFAQVIGELEDKSVPELRLGLGRDMRLSAPELAERYRDGMVAEGATVLDVGQV